MVLRTIEKKQGGGKTGNWQSVAVLIRGSQERPPGENVI